MPKVVALPSKNESNTLTDFKNLLISKHQYGYVSEVDNIVSALGKYGFKINKEYKRESLKKLDFDLYELRTKHIRIFLYFDGNDFFVLLHGFIKKSQETPFKELKLAKEEVRRCQIIAKRDL